MSDQRPTETQTPTPAPEGASGGAPESLLGGAAGATASPDAAGAGATAGVSAEPTFDPKGLKLPEGVKPEGEAFDKFSAIATELKIPQARAQELFDLHHSAITQATTSLQEAWFSTQREWQAAVTADKEIGGQQLDEVKQTISKLLDNDKLSDPKFREALDFTGAGNNPAVIRTLYRWAKVLTEGGSVAGSPASPAGPKSAADAMYPGGPHTGGPRI